MSGIKEVCKKAILQLDEKNVFWCNQFSRMHCNVWMVTGMAILTATYDIFCVFLVTRLIGRRYFTDDPIMVQRLVLPGRMTLGKEGILLSICMFGAFIGNLFFGSLGDRCGRKMILEIALVIMFFFSIFSAFSFTPVQSQAYGNNILGSLCFFRVVLGFGVGAIFPVCATIMSEYSSKFSRGGYLGLIFSMQGAGFLLACGVAAIANYGVRYNFPSGEFPTSIPSLIDYPGCASFLYFDVEESIACPSVNQQAYADAVYASNISQSEYIWRAVVSAGAAPALVTFLLSRCFLVETPRYTSHVVGNYQKAITDLASQGEDHTDAALAAVFNDAEKAILSENDENNFFSELTFCGFLFHYSWHIFAAGACYAVVNFVFNGMILQVNTAINIVGYTKQAKYQSTVEENVGFIIGFVILILVPLVPGYFFTALTVDAFGHRILQFFGFIITAGFLGAAGGTKSYLTNPNNPGINMGLDSYSSKLQGAWLFLFAASFFFMSWGPLSTIFIITAELFPTRWRSTGYGICNAMGNIFGCVGVFVFLYAQQPESRSTTFSFPCDRTNAPSDIALNTCIKVNDCPNGRTPGPEAPIGGACKFCLTGSYSGCAPFGVGQQGAMAIMIPILFFGAMITQLLPITTYQSLEDINYMNEVNKNSKEDTDSDEGEGKEKENKVVIVGDFPMIDGSDKNPMI